MLCTAMVILKGRGKTNQYGKPLFSGYFRHVDVKLCAVSAAAFFLFHRYHIMDEPLVGQSLLCDQNLGSRTPE